MGTWDEREGEMTTPEDMRTWVARAIWWQGRLDLLRIAREALQVPESVPETAEPVVERVQPARVRRPAPVVGA